jgi:hypothetical protein
MLVFRCFSPEQWQILPQVGKSLSVLIQIDCEEVTRQARFGSPPPHKQCVQVPHADLAPGGAAVVALV